MENFRKNKKLLRSVLSLILAIAMIFSYFTFPDSLLAKAANSKDEYEGQFQTTTVSISNGQFDSLSGSFPKTPSSWTGSFLETEIEHGSIISGVIDLSASSYSANSETYKLSKYAEYANEAPRTPFGVSSIPNGSLPYYEGTNTNVLMINTDGASTAYRYRSSSVSLSANSFYKLSAWVKTTDFTGVQNSGAAIRLSGIEDRDIAFNNINTVRGVSEFNSANNYGWQKYVIYVSTNYRAQSVSLNLQIGDTYADEYYYPTNGYALFANITAYQISPEDFDSETEIDSPNVLVADLNTDNYLIKTDDSGRAVDENNDYVALENAIDIGSFTNIRDGRYPLGWTSVDEDGTGGANVAVFNPKTFSSTTNYGLTSNPAAPRGIEREGGNNILVISSPNKAVANGLKSSNILIERNRYYRIAAWVKTHETAAVATIAIKGEGTSYGNEVEVIHGSLFGDENNLNRYGWKQESFYVKGSSVMNTLIHIELWLGQVGNKTKGIAMFDDVTIEAITQKEYSDNVASGQDVQIDGNIGNNTGVNNGLFYTAGTFTEYEYPLPPSNWTMYDASNSGIVGHSTSKVNTKNIKSGIIPVDKEHFDANRHNYLNANNPLPLEEYPRNVLFLGSDSQTAFGYRSDAITINPASLSRIYVKLMTENIVGHGANLILKNNDNIISTIEMINTNGEFETFDFYVEGHTLNSGVLTIEIWLGMGDKLNNQTKRSSGHVFVEEAGHEQINTEETFDDFVTLYRNATHANIASLNTNYFINYNRYSSGFLKESYDWILNTSRNAKASANNTDIGIFNYSQINDSQSIVPKDFKLDSSGNQNIFLMHNKVANAATAIYQTNYTLEQDYYEITVSMKVDIPEEFINNNPDAIGATLSLKGSAYEFEDIKDSKKITSVYDDAEGKMVDKLTDTDFKTYTFFVHTDSNMSNNVSFEVSLGGYKNSAEFCEGRVYIASINIKEITGDFYKASVKNLDDNDPYIINADLTTAENNTSTPNPNGDDDNESWWKNNWGVIPSAIFGLTLVFVLIYVVIRKVIESKPKRAKKVKKKKYDRDSLAENENAAQIPGENKEYTQVSYDEFDDDIDVPKQEPQIKREKTVAEQTTTASQAETSDTSATEVADEETDGTANKETMSENDNLAEFDE